MTTDGIHSQSFAAYKAAAGSKRTPGPWRVDGSTVVADADTGHDDPDNVRAYKGHLIAESIWWPGNAALIAAAPELFEALRKIAEHDYTKADESKMEDNPTMIWQAVARDAIKKVTDAN